MPTSSQYFSSGFKGKKKAKRKPPPPSQSGGTSGDLSIPHKTETPVSTTPYRPDEPPTTVQREIRKEKKAAKRGARPRKAAKQRERQALRKAKRILSKADLGVEDTPQFHYQQAKTKGIAPPAKLRKENPPAYEKAVKAFGSYHAEREGLKEDPLAELVISGVATGGVGLAAKAALKGATTLGRSLASSGAEKAAETGAKTAGKTAARSTKGGVKARPGSLRAKGQKNLARHEANQAAKRASRKIRPKAKQRAKLKARRKAQDFRIRHGKEGRKVARRTREVKLGLAAPQLTATGAGVGGLGVLGAAVEGHVEAIRESPGKVAARTLEIAPGLVVSTADLVAQVGQAIGTDDTSGLEKRISEDVSFAKDLASVMASGDKERVQKYVEEQGLVAPLIAAPTIAKVAGRPIKAGARSVAPERVQRAARRKGERKQSARDAAREEAMAQAEVRAAGRPIVQAYTGKKLRRGVRKRKKLRDKIDRGDLVAMVAEEGLTPQSARANFPRVAEKWNRRPRFEDKKEGGVTGHDLVELVKREPDVFDDRAFWRTVEAYRAQEPAVRTSERVIDIEQAKTHGVRLAEERPTPRAREGIPNVGSRGQVMAYLSKGGEGGKRIRRLRETKRAAEGKARELRAVSRLPGGRGKRQQLLDVEADIRGMRAELAETQRRHQEIKRSLKDPAESQALQAEFDAELAAVREDRGLARGAYVPHVDVGKEGIPVAQPVVRAGKKVYERSAGPDSFAERGRVDYSLPTLLEAGTQAPRIRKGVHQYVNQQVHEGAIRIPVTDKKTGNVEMRRVATREQFERGLTPEQKREVSLFPLSQFNQAVKDGSIEKITGAIKGLGREIDWASDTKGVKYIALDRNRAAEIKAQVSAPGTGLHLLQAGSSGLSRVILASPAWLTAQFLAEGLQGALAINPLNPMNVYHTLQGYRGLKKMSPQKRREFRAISGAMPGMGASPSEWFAADGRTHRGLATNFKKAERIMPIKRLTQAVKLDWLRAIDRAKGGEFRTAVAVTKAHKDAMGFGKRLERLFKGQRQLSERLAKMSPDERLEWSIRSTPAKRKVENYLDDVLGNWRALSRKEKVSSPLLIFYPFLRMSLQWPFYSFPKRHPARAAVMYEMAAAHNEQLRALLGGPPSWFGDYATAIVYGNEPGSAKTIRATRIVPGANAIFEAVTTGGDVALQRTTNPVVGYFNALVNGIDPLSGEKVDPDYLSAEERFIARAGLVTSLLFNTPPPLRALDQLKGSKESTSLPLIGPRRKKDALGNLLEELNGTPEERAFNTLFNPFPMKDIDTARDGAAMGRIFEIWRTAGSDAQDAVINDDSLSTPEKKRRLKVMRDRSDEADAELHRLYRKYDIAFEKEEKAETERYYDLKYPEPKKKKKTNPYLEAAEETSGGNVYLEALEGTKSKGNAYLEALK